MVAPEDYLQKTSLRPMLASLLEKTCKDKPDNLVPFMLEYLQTTYPDAAKAAQPANPPGSLGSWSKRPDVQPTQEVSPGASFKCDNSRQWGSYGTAGLLSERCCAGVSEAK